MGSMTSAFLSKPAARPSGLGKDKPRSFTARAGLSTRSPDGTTPRRSAATVRRCAVSASTRCSSGRASRKRFMKRALSGQFDRVEAGALLASRYQPWYNFPNSTALMTECPSRGPHVLAQTDVGCHRCTCCEKRIIDFRAGQARGARRHHLQQIETAVLGRTYEMADDGEPVAHPRRDTNSVPRFRAAGERQGGAAGRVDPVRQLRKSGG